VPLTWRNLVLSVLWLRCPICLKGRVFRNLLNIHRECSECGYFFTRESGYFLGSVYFGYAATIAVAIGAWLLFARGFALGWSNLVLFVVLAVVFVFPIWFFRYSRMLWMALDLYLNPPVSEDFQERGR
jgi:uncharacterized protein (DUF983 family)